MNRICLFLLILPFTGIESGFSQEKSFSDKLIESFKRGGMNPETIDWDTFEMEVKKNLEISKIEGIKKALTLYGNKHTFYRYKGQMLTGDYEFEPQKNNCYYPENTLFRQEASNIGYINIASFGLSPELSESAKRARATTYVSAITEKIKEQDSKELTGWVIDLRYNGGGNMWPMLLALRPFFTQEVLGYFIKGEQVTKWSYRNNDIFIGRVAQKQNYLNENLDYELKNKDKKVAVLIGDRTSSSGEAAAIALGSIKKMAYFGDNTSGYSTANQVIEMGTDEYLILTSSVMADYNKKEYWEGLQVRQPICEEAELLEKVLNWMKN